MFSCLLFTVLYAIMSIISSKILKLNMGLVLFFLLFVVVVVVVVDRISTSS